MLNSSEQETSIAHKYQNSLKKLLMKFPGLNHECQSFILLINVKCQQLLCRINFIDSSVEHENSFISLGPGSHEIYHLVYYSKGFQHHIQY